MPRALGIGQPGFEVLREAPDNIACRQRGIAQLQGTVRVYHRLV